MKKLLAIILVFFGTGLVALVVLQGGETGPPELEVYGAVMDWMAEVGWVAASEHPVAVVDRTAFPWHLWNVPRGCFGPERPGWKLWWKFHLLNLVPRHINRSMPSVRGLSFEFLDDRRLEEIFEGPDPWGPQGPGVFHVFSRVGFDGSGEKAVVYVMKACPLCGLGAFFLVQRADVGWTVTGSCLAWES